MIAPISSGKGPLTADEAEQLEREASASVDEALGELLAVRSNTSRPEGERQRAVEAIVRRWFDYPSFSRFALARSKSRFSQEQLDRYGCEFDAYLSNYIGTQLARYHQEQTHVSRATALPSRDVVLSTRISGGKFDQAVVAFLMREIDPDTDKWRVIGISFDGTAVRRLLREQFQPVLKAGGPDDLIAMLREKAPGQSRCATSDAGLNREHREAGS
jgi:ABC-type transporter MlaC component